MLHFIFFSMKRTYLELGLQQAVSIETIPYEIIQFILSCINKFNKIQDIRTLNQLRLVSSLFKNNISCIFKTFEFLDDDVMMYLEDKHLKIFCGLNILNLNRNKHITDEGIKGMSLHTLNLAGNCNITDDGIKDMSLHILNLRCNKKITDDGIKGMPLHTLNLTMNNKITDDGIKGMPLHTLNLTMNRNITDYGIKGMSLHTLNLNCNKMITIVGIKGICLHELIC
jgi:hypothetical protein